MRFRGHFPRADSQLELALWISAGDMPRNAFGRLLVELLEVCSSEARSLVAHLFSHLQGVTAGEIGIKDTSSKSCELLDQSSAALETCEERSLRPELAQSAPAESPRCFVFSPTVRQSGCVDKILCKSALESEITFFEVSPPKA